MWRLAVDPHVRPSWPAATPATVSMIDLARHQPTIQPGGRAAAENTREKPESPRSRVSKLPLRVAASAGAAKSADATSEIVQAAGELTTDAAQLAQLIKRFRV